MEQKIFELTKKGGITIGISSEKNVLNCSIIPREMSDRAVPVSFSCVEGNFFQSLDKALTEALNGVTEVMNTEDFKKSIAPKKDAKPNEPGLFAEATPEDKQNGGIPQCNTPDCNDEDYDEVAAEVEAEGEEIQEEQISEQEKPIEEKPKEVKKKPVEDLFD